MGGINGDRGTKTETGPTPWVHLIVSAESDGWIKRKACVCLYTSPGYRCLSQAGMYECRKPSTEKSLTSADSALSSSRRLLRFLYSASSSVKATVRHHKGKDRET